MCRGQNLSISCAVTTRGGELAHRWMPSSERSMEGRWWWGGWCLGIASCLRPHWWAGGWAQPGRSLGRAPRAGDPSPPGDRLVSSEVRPPFVASL